MSSQLDAAEAMFAPAFALHGKTIKGSMSMGEVYALNFTDGTHLWLRIEHHGPQDGGRVSIKPELREGPL
jgi:hypothetical protein